MKILAKIIPWGVGLITLFLLIAHTFAWSQIKVDIVTIFLLTIISLVPLFELVRKVKFGEFEAEIAPREVAEASTKLEKLTPVNFKAEKIPEGGYSEILDLVKIDLQLGFAKLRMELERLLRGLYSASFPKIKAKKFIGLGGILRELRNANYLSVDIASGLNDVIGLSNRAVHGEIIKQKDAEELATMGVQLLNRLRFIYTEKIAGPVETVGISKKKCDKYATAKYKVKTIVPLEEPYINTYILDQSGLDDLLEGYEEYAEFIVSVEELDGNEKEKTNPAFNKN